MRTHNISNGCYYIIHSTLSSYIDNPTLQCTEHYFVYCLKPYITLLVSKKNYNYMQYCWKSTIYISFFTYMKTKKSSVTAFVSFEGSGLFCDVKQKQNRFWFVFKPLYKWKGTVFSWITEILLWEDRTQSTRLIMSGCDILVPKNDIHSSLAMHEVKGKT